VDAAPTSAQQKAITELSISANLVEQQWKEIESKDLPAINDQIAAAGLTKIELGR
jgi:hypothetical protein